MMKMIAISIVALMLLSGCSTKSEDAYYSAMANQRAQYMKAYDKMEEDRMTLNCESKCSLVATRPKALPRFQNIAKPMTNGEMALRWAGVLTPSIVGVAGLYYNHKTSTDLSNDSKDIAIANVNADSRMFEAMAKTPNTEPSVDNSVVNTYDYSMKTDSFNTNSGDDYTSSRNPATWTDDNSDNSVENLPVVP